MKTFKKKISNKKAYREYVGILNGKLQLSHREVELFAVLLQINLEWGSMVKEMGSVLSTDSRKVLMRETRITKSNLARYITALKNKGILIPSENGGFVLNSLFIPEFTVDEKTGKTVCEIKFILEVT